jgi:hypothetical protein
MPAGSPREAQDRWCDANGTQIPLFCWVEQVAESAEPTALPSRLHQQGQVVGRGLDSFYVRFSGNYVVSLEPHLLRVLDDAPDGE